MPDAGDGVQHDTGQNNEDAHQDESFIVGAEGIVHETCRLTCKLENIFNTEKIFYQQ